ncbi:alpha/beta fold hydrolase [Novosphingobium humi]|uniref:Alpha/beta hydrolase n=1 Tax=Novosphingobium humi TaxID=2282397 RepID=A0ABY7U2L5_9SPHN|nr:alpha/beta hydrolase [Novosphingobium humi]WCT79463.1 alpha/beta hydrolase [Novosphingobium humi]WJT00545.1 alpha/beta hydrolase [Novosphingobium humi]
MTQAAQDLSRRHLLTTVGAMAGTAALVSQTPTLAAAPKKAANSANTARVGDGYVTTPDGARLYYKDWGTGQPIVFHHGWPLTADDWDAQMMFFLEQGFRVIAFDRRGHGRSSQTMNGNDMDTYASDTAVLVRHLDLHDAVHIGHSTGGGVVAAYVARYGEGRVAKAVLVGAVPPIMLKTAAYPGGLPLSVFDGFRKALAENRADFFWNVPVPFYGFNRPGQSVNEAIRQNWWRQGMMGGAKAQYDSIKAFSETDQTEDLKAINVPVLIQHGDDDQIVPVAASAHLQAKLIRNNTLKIYPGYPHGMLTTHADVLNRDILAFIKG